MTSSLIARRLERAPNFCVRTWGLRAAATTLSPRSNASLTNRAPNPRDAPVINHVFIRYSFEFFLSLVREGGSKLPPFSLFVSQCTGGNRVLREFRGWRAVYHRVHVLDADPVGSVVALHDVHHRIVGV